MKEILDGKFIVNDLVEIIKNTDEVNYNLFDCKINEKGKIVFCIPDRSSYLVRIRRENSFFFDVEVEEKNIKKIGFDKKGDYNYYE